ncbi:MAG: hypothetical protein D6754_07935 [Alphaproteobacteria bacterium]|nr:MAG: hypothetical protein D6754_07935 [Alphaproteobacteria bacterium]
MDLSLATFAEVALAPALAPLAAAAPQQPGLGAGPMIRADGTPDIGAVVARLEARVAAGDAPPAELAMLPRSYDTLGRIADARTMRDLPAQLETDR